MRRTTADDSVKAFLARREKLRTRKRTIWTDGNTLYSYARPIARHVGNSVVVADRRISVTTSRHVGAIKSRLIADRVGFYITEDLDSWPRDYDRACVHLDQLLETTNEVYVVDFTKESSRAWQW